VSVQNAPMYEPMRIAAVILAAGASTRFGSPKQLVRIGDRTMLETVIQLARDAGLAPVIAVVPPGLAVAADVVPVVNTDPDAGLSRSLRLGIGAVPAELDAAVVLLGDQPTMRVATIRNVLAARGRNPVVAARADGRLAPPVLLMRAAFGLVEEASGDTGLGPVLVAHPELVTAVEVDAHVPDVDTPADLARLV
jgi:molybdenum cofactor cytidylyltransferase